MKTKFRLLAFLMCMILTFLPILTACETPTDDPNNTDTGTGTGEQETDRPAVPIMIFEDKEMSYSFIYPADCSEDLKAAAEDCYKDFKKRLTNEPAIGDDETVEESTFEILFGATNRSESQTIAQEAEGNAYYIKFIGRKIVVYATEEWMYSNAVKALIRQLTYGHNAENEIVSATLPDNLNVIYDFEVETGYSRSNWVLSDFPAYFGGVLGENTYTQSLGYNSLSTNNKSQYQMLCATATNAEDFEAYADKLANEGYEVQKQTDTDDIIGYWVQKGSRRMYMYCTVRLGEARFILDRQDAADLDEFSYEYVKQDGDNTTFYLYGLKMHPDGINIGEYYPDASKTAFYSRFPELKSMAGKIQNSYKNCGAMLVIKLADNSVMIIDGGEKAQMSVEAGENFNKFLHEITGTPEGETVRIACWFLTHPHGDHFGGFIRFMVNFHEQYELERVMYNLQSANDTLTTFLGDKYLKQRYPDIQYHKPHTGEIIQIADVTFQVMYTLEDNFDPVTGECVWSNNDDNSSSVVLKATIDDQTVLITGDSATDTDNNLKAMYGDGDGLKVDIMQAPHHNWNKTEYIFEAANSYIVICNQSSGGALKGLTGAATNVYNSLIKYMQGKNAAEKAANIYYGGDETVGFEVVDGKFEVVFQEDAVGAAWDQSDGGKQKYWGEYTDFYSTSQITSIKK